MTQLDPYIHRMLVVLSPDSPAKLAAHEMCEREVGCVLVSDERGELVGIVTDRDLACSLDTGSDGADTPLLEIMTLRPSTVASTSSIEHVADLMEDEGIRRVPIVEQVDSGVTRCLGVVTLDDLISSKAIGVERLARIVRSQLGRKWIKNSGDRSKAHLTQSVNHFYNKIFERVPLSIEVLVPVTQYLLGCLIRRVQCNAAANFIAQLPKVMQDDLLSLPAGPDRSIAPEFMIESLSSRFNMSRDMAAGVIENFFQTLSELVDSKEIENVQAQLPEDFRALFGPAKKARAKKAA